MAGQELAMSQTAIHVIGIDIGQELVPHCFCLWRLARVAINLDRFVSIIDCPDRGACRAQTRFHRWHWRSGGLAFYTDAQPIGRRRRIGVLMGPAETDPDGQARAGAFRDALVKLGWVDGRNVQVDYRWAAGDVARVVAMRG